MKRSLLLAALASLVACTHPKPVRLSSPPPEAGKPTAPVGVDAELVDDRATLSVKFERAGERISIDITGLEGLSVKGLQSLTAGDSVKAGETRQFDVTFERGKGRNELVVSVRGTFEGAPLARVTTFRLGQGGLEQSGTQVVTQDGETLKLMPSGK